LPIAYGVLAGTQAAVGMGIMAALALAVAAAAVGSTVAVAARGAVAVVSGVAAAFPLSGGVEKGFVWRGLKSAEVTGVESRGVGVVAAAAATAAASCGAQGRVGRAGAAVQERAPEVRGNANRQCFFWCL
jgi:hypothetical protein